MGKCRSRKYLTELKRRISPKDSRLKKNDKIQKKNQLKLKKKLIEVPKVSSSMFFKHNTALGPPYRVLIDTNFINFSIQNKIDIVQGMMDCLYAKCTPYVIHAVIAELEKLGPKFRVALRISKDPRFERLPTETEYADDELVKLVKQHPCFIVATCDRDLKRRIRKIPGVPIMCIKGRKFTIERMPDAVGRSE